MTDRTRTFTTLTGGRTGSSPTTMVPGPRWRSRSWTARARSSRGPAHNLAALPALLTAEDVAGPLRTTDDEATARSGSRWRSNPLLPMCVAGLFRAADPRCVTIAGQGDSMAFRSALSERSIGFGHLPPSRTMKP